ncbi:GNAT family N-acetyltransferase [Virgibacillus doumboii]|uniref:GNAT family N-acetyltransferase n=1 Tax=Virgibacillus doumboii TaxID=2697503 RepID=UPI0013DFED29|nr:GNAT family N-acetyltransferase [Virgibacillus doumboii]
MTKNVEIRQLTTMEELREMQQVEEAVWQMPPNAVHQTYTALKNGGVILGAFDNDKMIGFLYSFAGFDGKKSYLCSHMLGILPDYRKGGLGKRMKLKQAETASKIGYSLITWTFDPLESLNAYLNLHKLGAIGASYKKNHYGSMNDGLNQGLPTDRIQIEWYIDEQKTPQNIPLDNSKLLLDVNESGIPFTKMDTFNPANDNWFVAIPSSFQTIKKQDFDLAKKWKQQSSEVFEILFKNGYTATDLLRDDSKQISYYYFCK